MAGHLRKVDSNEIGSWGRFSFTGLYVDKEVSMDSTEEAERFVGLG